MERDKLVALGQKLRRLLAKVQVGIDLDRLHFERNLVDLPIIEQQEMHLWATVNQLRAGLTERKRLQNKYERVMRGVDNA